MKAGHQPISLTRTTSAADLQPQTPVTDATDKPDVS